MVWTHGYGSYRIICTVALLPEEAIVVFLGTMMRYLAKNTAFAISVEGAVRDALQHVSFRIRRKQQVPVFRLNDRNRAEVIGIRIRLIGEIRMMQAFQKCIVLIFGRRNESQGQATCKEKWNHHIRDQSTTLDHAHLAEILDFSKQSRQRFFLLSAQDYNTFDIFVQVPCSVSKQID